MVCILGAPNSSSRMVVLEGGLDALALAQIENRNDTIYVSTGGGFRNGPSSSCTGVHSALKPYIEKVWGIVVPSPTEAFTNMKARVLYAREPDFALKMGPATSRHTDAYDQRPANWTHPPEGRAIPASSLITEYPAATDGDCSPS